MARYRVLKDLRGRERKGETSPLEGLTPEQIEKLVEVGAVSRISPPMLADLPTWEERAAQLAEIGINDGEQLLDADPVIIAAGCGISDEDAQQWQDEMRSLLTLK